MKTIYFWIFGITIGLLSITNNFKTLKHKEAMIPFDNGDKYKKEWAKVDSLINLGQPKSALEIVDVIYGKAKTAKNSDQIIKAFIYKLKLKNSYEEDAFEILLKELEAEAKVSEFPNNSIMHSMLAEMYWMYYNSNRWKFQKRTNTIDFKKDDIKTWTLDQLTDMVIKNYLLSLTNKDELQKTPMSKYDEIIVWGTKPKNLRPTLYDFLAHRAIDFFSISEVSLSRPADYFQLREDFYFDDIENFINQKIQTNDTLSLYFHGVKILQDLLRFRLENKKETSALIDANLKRLNFVYGHSVNEQKNQLYFDHLNRLLEKYKTDTFAGEIMYLIANHYISESSKYDPFNSDTHKYKNNKIKAKEICEEVMKKYPKEEASPKSENLLYQIYHHELSFQTENVLIPNEKSGISISYRNIDEIHLRVASINRNEIQGLKEKYYGKEFFEKIKLISKTVYSTKFNVPKDDDYNSHRLNYLIEPLQPGFYVIMMSNTEKFISEENIVSYALVTVSNISYIQQKTQDGSYNIHVLNRKTGEPISEVNVQTYFEKYNYQSNRYVKEKDQKYLTDKDGYFKILSEKKSSDSKNLFMEFTKEKDFLSSDESIYLYHYKQVKNQNYRIHLFTDRAIYRPGQTVYFKGIMTYGDTEQNQISPKNSVSVILYDPNYQKVSDIQLTTNEFGTFSGTFNLPTNLLNGFFQIYTAYGAVSISVEEYKRPTFEVEMLPFEGNYRLNDSVEVKGKAKNFAGSMLTDAQVKYRVQRQPLWRGWWYWYFPVANIEIENGVVTTNDNGEFTIKFKAIPDLSMPNSDYLVFNYRITADVTDLNGETQSTGKSMVVGNKALQIDVEIPEKILKENPPVVDWKIKINSTNMNGSFLPAKGKIKISKLDDYAQVFRPNKLPRPDKYIFTKEQWYKEYPGNVYDNENDITQLKITEKILEEQFNTEKNKNIDLSQIKNWKSGQYVIEMESTDAFGSAVSFKRFFTVYSEKDKTLPFKNIDWFNQIQFFCEPGQNAKLIIGSAAEKLKIIYEIEHKGEIVKKEWINISNQQKIFEIPVEEKHRGNFCVHFTFVKENSIYKHTSLVYVPYTNKMLDIEFQTFRDKLQPGQDEEWKLIIKGKNGDKVAAELLATLYDESLDKFASNAWGFNVYTSYYSNVYWTTGTFRNLNGASLSENYNKYISLPSYYYDSFNWFGFYYYEYQTYWNYDYDIDFMMIEDAMPVEKAVKRESQKSEEIMSDQDTGGKVVSNADVTTIAPGVMEYTGGESNIAPPKDDFSEVKVRTNFNETAFFFPHLQTNENGEVIVKFTVPESLTRWKMMGFAHTKDLKYGFKENHLVTQKDLMLLPNAPRFFRENDLIEFPVKISNISDKNMTGKIQLEILDATTLKPVNILAKSEITTKDFTVDTGKNTLVTWVLNIPEGFGALAYKVVAKTDNASDGEQKALPVLTNRMLVTESMPLPIRSKQTKTFTFDKLLNSAKSTTLRHHRLTLEFTSNPAWYAIQALPYIMEYPYECAEQTFSRYYANAIASHIANSTPKVKAVFDSWKNTKGGEALLSNLEKNQELKSVLLEETPWVLQSQNETERKKRVGLLFDLNRMADELGRAIKKLEKQQTINGGWPWFEGMPESRYITQHIMVGMGHLDRLGVKNVRDEVKVWNMVKKAVQFCDERMKEDYDWLKKHYTAKQLEENHLSEITIHYFYGRTYFTDIEVSNRHKEAFDYFKKQMEKYWLSNGKYQQGMIALALFRLKTDKIPALIIKSLKENSLEHEELGMYWKDNVSGYYWYQAPIETQAMMIEAFDEVANDKTSVESLKVWLLKQKQTQDWKTTKATVEACYALLMRGTAWLASDEICTIKMGDMQIDPKKMPDVQMEAGTGYFKTSWSGGEIKPEWGKVTVSKPDEGVSWGAVYWQYFEQLDKITPAETPLKLEKKLFREVITTRGKVIEPITEKTKLKVGDKIIVRIELRVDRDMDYVHMKDMRASGFEPINVISRYKYQDGLGYYESTKDASTNFFFDRLRKGTFVFEYPLRVTHNGDFSNGITTIQCMYAPEFTSHSEGIRVKIEK